MRMSRAGVTLWRMLRLERHELGPRVYVLRRRVHEYELGLAILALLGVGALLGWVRPDEATALAASGAVWLIAKDWRDIFPSTRDTTAWCVGVHRRPTPLRTLRSSGLLPSLAALVALSAGIVDLISTV